MKGNTGGGRENWKGREGEKEVKARFRRRREVGKKREQKEKCKEDWHDKDGEGKRVKRERERAGKKRGQTESNKKNRKQKSIKKIHKRKKRMQEG